MNVEKEVIISELKAKFTKELETNLKMVCRWLFRKPFWSLVLEDIRLRPRLLRVTIGLCRSGKVACVEVGDRASLL